MRTLPWRTFCYAVGALCILPLALVAIALIFSPFLPGALVIFVVAVLLGVMLAIQIALIVLALYIATRNEVTLRGGTLHLKGGEFHERVPLDDIVAVKQIAGTGDLAMPRLKRRNGIALPGFRVGWYQRDDSRYVFVIQARQAAGLYIHTRIRFDVLLGVDDPAGLGQRLLANRVDDRD